MDLKNLNFDLKFLSQIELGFISIKTRNFQILVTNFIKIISLLGLKFSLISRNTGLYRTEVLEKFQEKLHFFGAASGRLVRVIWKIFQRAC